MNANKELSKAAWIARDNAIILGTTKVGCAILSETGKIYSGCNIGHIFRCDIHAEIGAVSAMVASGDKNIHSILIVAEREHFTPCGACMDWIMQLGTSETSVGFQSSPDSKISWLRAGDLMPYYPK